MNLRHHLEALTELHTDAQTWNSDRKGVAILLDMYLTILSDAIKVITSLVDYFEKENA